MNIGAMKDELLLQEPSGTEADSYTELAKMPAHIAMVFGGGTEALRFGAPSAIGYFKITTRYRTDLRASQRLVNPADGHVYQISSYGDPKGKREETVIYATEIQ